MPKIPDITEILDGRAPPLQLRLQCNACGNKQNAVFAWAFVDIDHDPADKSWDGIVLSRTFRCKKCSAVDDYTLETLSKLALTFQTLPAFQGRKSVVAAALRMWDGTNARRPSHAMAHLLGLAHEHGTAEAWRRLGNACERFGEGTRAVEAWTRAVELDPEELDAVWSLFVWHANQVGYGDVALAYLRHAVAVFVSARKKDPTLERFAGAMAAEMIQMAKVYPSALGLVATWRDGAFKDHQLVSISQADLADLPEVDLLEEFLIRDDLIGLLLVQEPTADRPTRLEGILHGTQPARPDSQWTLVPTASRVPIRVAKVPGRNDPCSCGSAKKYKKCCGA